MVDKEVERKKKTLATAMMLYTVVTLVVFVHSVRTNIAVLNEAQPNKQRRCLY